PSQWARLRPSRSGRSQARRTTWLATAGATTALGTTARGVRQTLHTPGEKAFGPLTAHGPLHADGRRHGGWGGPLRQQADNRPPSGQSCSAKGRPLPPFQRRTLFGGQDNVSRRLAATCHDNLLPALW